MKIKTVGKAIIAGVTMVGGAILALQSKKDWKDKDFDATLEPLGEEPETETVKENDETEPEVEIIEEEES